MALRPKHSKLSELEGICKLHAVEGINLLEYQPRDILYKSNTNELIVVTPQAFVSHPQGSNVRVFSQVPDHDLQSLTWVGDNRLFGLSVGPFQTELIEFNNAAEIESTIWIQDTPSKTGSMVFVPSSNDREHTGGKLYIYLDGNMNTYHVLPNESSSVISRTGSINMKVMNQGRDDKDPITAMEHFEGLTHILRGERDIIEVWDLTTATLLDEISLPSLENNDKWVGMALERRNNKEEESLRKGASLIRKGKTSVYLHMPLDTFPPQLWSFRLEEDDDNSMFAFPDCDAVAMN